MKFIAVALLLLPIGAIAQDRSASHAFELSANPEAELDEHGVCHITGAIWRDDAGSQFSIGAAVRNERMVLRQVGTGKTYETKTDDQGIYRISIPVSGHAVFQETEIGRRGWHGSTPKIYCARVRVEVGEIIPVRS